MICSLYPWVLALRIAKRTKTWLRIATLTVKSLQRMLQCLAPLSVDAVEDSKEPRVSHPSSDPPKHDAQHAHDGTRCHERISELVRRRE